MFMMSQKKKKMIITVVAVFVSFVFMLSVVAGYFSTNGYTYNYKNLPVNNSVPSGGAATGSSGNQTQPASGSAAQNAPNHTMPMPQQ